MNTAHTVSVQTEQKGIHWQAEHKRNTAVLSGYTMAWIWPNVCLSIRQIHTCIRKSFLTIWCNCGNSKHQISTNTHTMNQSAKKLISHCTQVYLEKIREKHRVVNASREPSTFYRFPCFNRDFFINVWLSFEFLCRMGDLYYDVSEDRSASFMVNESGLRGSGWKVFVSWSWRVSDKSYILGRQQGGASNEPMGRCFKRINTTLRTLPVSETSCWCGEPVTNWKSPKKHPWQKLLSKVSMISKCSQSSPVEVNKTYFIQSCPTLSSRVRAFP